MKPSRPGSIAVLLLSLAGCGPGAPSSSDDVATPAPEPSAAEGGATAEVDAQVDPNCARSFCGCWQPARLSFEGRIVDASGAPIEGVALTCSGEDAPVAQSDATGRLAFTIDTMNSPGCHYQRCTNLRFSDSRGRFADRETTVYVANGATLTLEPGDR
jgi:hypothetical protein